MVARRRNLDWLGLLPFLAFLGLFLVWPTVTIFTQAFDAESGVSTTAFTEAVTGQYRRSFIASLKLSLVTALLGGFIGVLLAYAAAIAAAAEVAPLRRSPRSVGWRPTSAASRWPSRSSPHSARKA